MTLLAMAIMISVARELDPPPGVLALSDAVFIAAATPMEALNIERESFSERGGCGSFPSPGGRP